ncbi:hypothetical protein ACFQ71_42280 [Streptomyces sp. NPDC056534]|uniref:hypothetical protein n=1 Tax=Streptomyces sp. NPDC056534 TaxID=3345857 RepID=UPI0036CBAF13
MNGELNEVPAKMDLELSLQELESIEAPDLISGIPNVVVAVTVVSFSAAVAT